MPRRGNLGLPPATTLSCLPSHRTAQRPTAARSRRFLPWLPTGLREIPIPVAREVSRQGLAHPLFPSLSASATWSCLWWELSFTLDGPRPHPGTSPKHHLPRPRPGCLPDCCPATLSPDRAARGRGRRSSPIRPGRRPRRICSVTDTRLAPVSSDSPGRGPGRSRGLFPRPQREAGGPPGSVGSLRGRGGRAGKRSRCRTFI